MTEKRKRGRASWAEAVIAHIPAHEGAEPVSVAYLMEMTGLSNHQVRDGVAELRDFFKGDGEAPLVSGPKGYRFTFEGDAVMAFQKQRAKVAHTTMTRLWTGAVKRYIASLPDPVRAKVTTRQFERAIEDIGDLIGV